MARIRTIKPDFFRHAGLYDAEQETGLPLRVAFAGLWTAADREGRFQWRPRELKLDCLPFDEVDFARVLDALRTRGHVVKYAIDGQEYGVIPSWHQHQVINNREAQSVIPAPTETSMESDTSTREARVSDASSTPLVHYTGEGKGKEGKERVDDATGALPFETPSRASVTSLKPSRFDDFWAAWPRSPRKVDRKACADKWARKRLDAEADAILADLAVQKRSKQWLEGFEPAPLTYLNRERWRDGVEAGPAGQPAEDERFAGCI